MPGENQQVEVRLRFSQAGLPDLGRAATATAAAFKGLSKEQEAIDAHQKSLYSGDTLRIAREMLRVQAERARLTRAESRQGLMAQREFRTSGRLLSDLRDQSQFHRQSTLEHFERRAVDHARRVKRIDSGEYLSDARRRSADRDRDRKAEERERRLDRRADLETRYGRRIGGGLHRFEQFAQRPGVRAATGAAAGAAGGIFAAGMAGFQGTVEMTRLTTEIQLLSREIAGALKPAIDGLTDVLRFVRQLMQKMTPGQQDLLMYGTLGAVGLKGLSMASRATTGMGLMELGGAGLNLLAMRRAGQAAKAAKVAEGAGAAGKVISGVEFAGRGAEVLGAGYLAKKAGFFGRLGGAARGFARGAGSLARDPLTSAILATTIMFKSTTDAFRNSGPHANDSYYNHFRQPNAFREGHSKGFSAAGAFGAALWDNIAAGVNRALPKRLELPRFDETFGVGGEKSPARKAADAKKKAEARRTVTPADAGFEGIGAGYDRLTVATAVRDYQADDKKKPDEKSADTLDKIWDWIQRQFGVEEAPHIKSKES